MKPHRRFFLFMNYKNKFSEGTGAGRCEATRAIFFLFGVKKYLSEATRLREHSARAYYIEELEAL